MGLADKLVGKIDELNKLTDAVTHSSVVNNSVVQGFLGNLSEVDVDTLSKQYGCYLMDGETIEKGFKLIRDVVLFTNCRIIDIDREGMTGQKVHVKSIYLDTLINVSLETAGFGLDDSELTVYYIASPYFKAYGGMDVKTRKFEFPKIYDIQPLYKYLQKTAYTNHQNLNR